MELLVTVHRPTVAMEREASGAGAYHCAWNDPDYPEIQIITAGDIVRGNPVNMPDRHGLTQYQPARRVRRGTQGRMGV